MLLTNEAQDCRRAAFIMRRKVALHFLYSMRFSSFLCLRRRVRAVLVALCRSLSSSDHQGTGLCLNVPELLGMEWIPAEYNLLLRKAIASSTD